MKIVVEDMRVDPDRNRESRGVGNRHLKPVTVVLLPLGMNLKIAHP